MNLLSFSKSQTNSNYSLFFHSHSYQYFSTFQYLLIIYEVYKMGPLMILLITLFILKIVMMISITNR